MHADLILDACFMHLHITLICLLQALSIPYCQLTWMYCMCVRIFETKYVKNRKIVHCFLLGAYISKGVE